MKKQIGVREIAYFLYSSGDLSSEFFSNTSASDGSKAHKFIQKGYNEDSIKEYYIKYLYKTNKDELTISGFIDGILNIEGQTVIEEIKSTKKNLDEIDLDYHYEHLAQLKLYAYMYCDLYNLDEVAMQLTYIRIEDYKTKSLPLKLTKIELETFFRDSLDKYLDWLSILDEASTLKMQTINNVKFPFSKMRIGQFDLMKASYYTLTHSDILYAIAPTGIGKTMATLFSGIKALESFNDKLFYLTSKNTQKNICKESLRILEDKGLKLKSIEITSKAHACLNGSKNCDPEKCIYAKGFFNRLRTAFDDIYKSYNLYDYNIIKEISMKHKICAFEFSLYLSYFCDCIICDYNYVFDPRAHLIRYFDDSSYNPKILIDEAHNLISRGKDMYSSSIKSSTIMKLYELLIDYDSSLTKNIKDFIFILNTYDEKLNTELAYYSSFLDDNIINVFNAIYSKALEIFTNEDKMKNRDDALTLFFNLKDFLDIGDYFSENHMFLIEKYNNEYIITITCFDASNYILDTVKNKCHGVVFFSATLYPINYHMDLLTKGEGKYMTLASPFPKENLKLIINNNISTKYKDREKTIGDIKEIIIKLTNSKKGNHIVFFPSYKYLELLYNEIKNLDLNIVMQSRDDDEIKRIEIMEEFKDLSKPHLGLFVLGGVFSEGIDFYDDLLNGVIVVGVGIPQINLMNNLCKEFFDDKYNNGFDYAYTYPGFNKVIQASGRVIRSDTDRGVVILIDERYKYNLYYNLMPSHWSNYKIINDCNKLEEELNEFYNK